MRVALSFAVIGLCMVIGLWILGFIGTADAFDGGARILGLVAVGAGGAFALFALLGVRPSSPGGEPGNTANGPRF